jgi:hypothetical protein
MDLNLFPDAQSEFETKTVPPMIWNGLLDLVPLQEPESNTTQGVLCHFNVTCWNDKFRKSRF